MTEIASRCSECNRTIYPARSFCPYCGPAIDIIEEIPLGSEGTILSYTISQMPPEGFEPPLILALIETSSGATILCHGDKDAISSLEVGCSVIIQKGSDGLFHFTEK
ncbi:MAG: hypothetical protein BAJATHORv1_30424 [Candidatus Thorarchaeota archaeon]|nr:MAG: hypothetical protein BAJATHORv1_30424 [Candidatus Thorarchaeota archaeon]